MTMELRRPSKIQEKINEVENDLACLFSEIAEKENLDFAEIALIPLPRRGAGLLPDIKRIDGERSSLISILEEFGYLEEYPLFPLFERISDFRMILIFDDLCRRGTHFAEYGEYLQELDKIFGFMNEKRIVLATYLLHKNRWNREKNLKQGIYAKKILDKEPFDREVSNIFLTIACRGEIIDADHELIEAEFSEKQEFFTLWKELEKIAKENHCELVEDGIDFLHPKRKKLSFFVSGDEASLEKKEVLEEHMDLRFPKFIEGIKIAKFRMVFELELSEDCKGVFTTRLEAVPILNPIIDNTKFSPELCRKYWKPYCGFCKEGVISEEECKKKQKPRIDFLRKYYHNPGYDCMICNLVEPFSNHFCKEIGDLFKESVLRGGITFKSRWLHRDRLFEFWRKLKAP
ncbi:MAG: hypothetical protein HXS52_10645 [Theionarchaea archaeon]|nr:hypothetical protein [Theionarchaea archaeon]